MRSHDAEINSYWGTICIPLEKSSLVAKIIYANNLY